VNTEFNRKAATEYLNSALERNRFVLYCQPIAQVDPHAAHGPLVEVLVRFRDEEEGLLPPGSFLPVLDEAHLTGILDRWVVAATLRMLNKASRGADPEPGPRCSINLSADALCDPDFPQFIAAQLAAAHVDPGHLMLEIPSPQDVAQPAAFEDAIRQLSAVGCAIALELPRSEAALDEMREQGVRYVKFNSFNLLRAGADAESLEALRAASERCHDLGIKMIAACVEWGESLATLADLRVEFAQGFAIAPPMPMAKAFGR
jgi:EAL domain-containing protein (putative c-di-GMP-specific phosphodiesterase class I)